MIKEMPEDCTMIHLKQYQTTFWRYQHYDSSCLATVESIYYFYRELAEERQKRGLASGTYAQIDDLMFLYALQYHNLVSANSTKSEVVGRS